jgi:hypothetical protein
MMCIVKYGQTICSLKGDPLNILEEVFYRAVFCVWFDSSENRESTPSVESLLASPQSSVDWTPVLIVAGVSVAALLSIAVACVVKTIKRSRQRLYRPHREISMEDLMTNLVSVTVTL